MSILARFREVWCVDFEFSCGPGQRPYPICCVAHEVHTGRTLRIWEDELRVRVIPPYATDGETLVVAYYASAEMGCHLALNWSIPQNILDLYAEFRNLTNGRRLLWGTGLVGALVHFELPAIEAFEKEEMRKLALRGGPWKSTEQAALLAYCESDVVALTRLLPRMLPHIDLPRALLRGRYMAAAARIEHTGTPMDVEALQDLQEHWEKIQNTLISRIDSQYGVFEAQTFKASRWEQWLERKGIPWPRHASGNLRLDDDTFRDMAKVYPCIRPIQQLRVTLAQMRSSEIAVGSDGRNRCLLSAFRAKTGRNQPSTTKFVFGPAVWLRGLIKPPPGYGMAYIDYSQQEFAIAAYLSRDKAMIDAYETGESYLAFAKQAGAVSSAGTKITHDAIREQFKSCALAVLYGMGAKALAQRISQSESQARHLLRLHRETYPTFWQWSDAVIDHAVLSGSLSTVFGWTLHLGEYVTDRTLRNFPMQANGAEILRWACCLATENGVSVCAPIHDALLIEAPLANLEAAIHVTQRAMAEACTLVLGTELRLESKVIRYPERYQDERGVGMWETVWQVRKELGK